MAGSRLHIGRQLEQRGERRFGSAAKLQIMIGDHAGALRIRPAGSSAKQRRTVVTASGGETRRGDGRASLPCGLAAPSVCPSRSTRKR